MTVAQIRLKTGLSQKAFGEKYHIPARSIENWEAPVDSANHRECPEYVVELLRRVVEIDF